MSEFDEWNEWARRVEAERQKAIEETLSWYRRVQSLVDQRNAAADCMAAFIFAKDDKSALVAAQEYRRAAKELKGPLQ